MKIPIARKRAPKSITENENSCFPRFNLFPWEIRHMIWAEALPAPIPQVLIYKPTTFPRWDPETKDWDPRDGPPTIPILPPAILHATQESRACALEHVLVRKAKKARTRCVAPSAYHHIVCRPFNRDTDALFVHKWHFPAFVEAYMATTPSAARHLIFDLDLYGVDGGMSPFFWLGASHIGWRDFTYQTDRCHGLRSVALAKLTRCYGRLNAHAEGDGEPRGYYRAVPDPWAAAWFDGVGEELGADLSGAGGPGGTPWRFRVSSNRLCWAAAEEKDDDEGLLECSQVIVSRVTPSTVADDWDEELDWTRQSPGFVR